MSEASSIPRGSISTFTTVVCIKKSRVECVGSFVKSVHGMDGSCVVVSHVPSHVAKKYFLVHSPFL